ncbi:MAG: hypothetical protein S4CHLAM20_04630 [Chlamydiia bacterium]|nr:hypothetical protein [Chlamydiia bacterium]
MYVNKTKTGMNITQELLDGLGIKKKKYKDEHDDLSMYYEYNITTKSNLKITVEFSKINDAGKWVDNGVNVHLDNGENLYPTKDCKTLQDLFQILRILGSSSVDLDAFEKLILDKQMKEEEVARLINLGMEL